MVGPGRDEPIPVPLVGKGMTVDSDSSKIII